MNELLTYVKHEADETNYTITMQILATVRRLVKSQVASPPQRNSQRRGNSVRERMKHQLVSETAGRNRNKTAGTGIDCSKQVLSVIPSHAQMLRHYHNMPEGEELCFGVTDGNGSLRTMKCTLGKKIDKVVRN